MNRRGVSILEALIAMVVLLIGLVGALAAMQQGVIEARQGQNRQQKLVIADASLQRLRLQDKSNYFSMATAIPRPSSNVKTIAVGTGPWVVDPLVGDPLDFSTGAYFRIAPDGTITKDATVAAGTACNAVPPGVVCREVLTHTGRPYTTFGDPAWPAGVQVATSWVRVSRRPDANSPAEAEVTLHQVVVR